MEREKGIILNRIFNPMQGDSLKDYYELDIIEHGSAEIFYGNGAMRFRPHAVFLAVSDRSLVIKPANAQEGLSILQIRFHKDMFAPSLLRLSEMQRVRLLLGHADEGLYSESEEVYEHLYAMSGQVGAENVMENFMSVYGMMIYLSERNAMKMFPSQKPGHVYIGVPRDAVVRKIDQYMSEHLSQPFRLSDIARIAGLTVTSLCRYYKKNTGYTPLVHMNQLRLQKACELLEQTDMTVKEITHECGYTDTNFFFKLFKRELGMTPVQFRRRKQ